MKDFSIASGSNPVVGPELWAQLQWDSDLWIIASGPGMAAPGFPYAEAAPALFDDGGARFGIAYRVPAVDVPAALGEMSKSERRNRAYGLHEIEAETPSGPVTGYVLAKRHHEVGQRKAA